MSKGKIRMENIDLITKKMDEIIQEFNLFKKEILSSSQLKLTLMEWFGSKKYRQKSLKLILEMMNLSILVCRQWIENIDSDTVEINEIIENMNNNIYLKYGFNPKFETFNYGLLINVRNKHKEIMDTIDKIHGTFENVSYSRFRIEISIDWIFKNYLSPFGNKPINNIGDTDLENLVEDICNQIMDILHEAHPYIVELAWFLIETLNNLSILNSQILNYDPTEIRLFEARHRWDKQKYEDILAEIVKGFDRRKLRVPYEPKSIEAYFTYNEFENNKLIGAFPILNTLEKQSLQKKCNYFEVKAKNLILKPSLIEFEEYQKEFKDFVKNEVNSKLTKDYRRFEVFLGKYSKLLCTDVYKYERYGRGLNIYPINVYGNKIAFNLFSKYKSITVFDTETTGLNPNNDNLIEFGCQQYSLIEGEVVKIFEENFLIKLPENVTLREKVEHLTGITNTIIRNQGLEIIEARKRIKNVFEHSDSSLFVAYNAQFDLSFLIEFMQDKNLFSKIDILDLYYSMSYIKHWYQYGDCRVEIENHKLENIANSLRIKLPSESFHRASFDSEILIEIIKKLEFCGHGESLLNDVNCLFLPADEFYKLPNKKYFDKY